MVGKKNLRFVGKTCASRNSRVGGVAKQVQPVRPIHLVRYYWWDELKF